MKLIHLNESKFKIIFESEEELPFKTFYDNILIFIQDLLNNPINAKPNKVLSDYRLDNGMLRKELLDYGIITKNEDIREPYDEVGKKKTSRYYVSYKVHTNNFKDNLRKLHTNIIKKLKKNE